MFLNSFSLSNSNFSMFSYKRIHFLIYSSLLVAKKKFKSPFIKILSPHLELKLKPLKDITGTPAHKDSKDVVTPLYGKVSSEISIEL